MIVLRRIIIVATAIAGLAMASAAIAQSVPPAPTSAAGGNAEGAIAAFARAFFEDDNDGMLAQLPTLVSEADGAGDEASAGILRLLLAALENGDIELTTSAIDVLGRMADRSIAGQIYDAILSLALELPIPPLGEGPPEAVVDTGLLPRAAAWGHSSLWQNSSTVETIPTATGWDTIVDGLFSATAEHGEEPPRTIALLSFQRTGPLEARGYAFDLATRVDAYQDITVARAMVLPLDAGGTVSVDLSAVPRLTWYQEPPTTPGRPAYFTNGDQNPEWLEAVHHADSFLVIFVLGDGDILQIRVPKGADGSAAFNQAFDAWTAGPGVSPWLIAGLMALAGAALLVAYFAYRRRRLWKELAGERWPRK